MESTENQMGRILVVSSDHPSDDKLISVAKAIASEPRLRILNYLTHKVASLSEISEQLDMPIATASLHLKSLEESTIISSHTVPGKRGQQRLYTRIYDSIVFHLPENTSRKLQQNFTIQMPIGAFVDHSVVPTCGLAGVNNIIGIMDDPISFYEPQRYHAQLVWFSHGYLEYKFPNHIYKKENPKSIQLSMEICSEAAPSADDWPSDISLYINDIKIGTWTSPADFGDKRGILTPEWWGDWNSQYGWLKFWRVDHEGASIDGRLISDISIDALSLSDKPYITVRIGIDDDAVHRGGLNLFGKQFGNHAQGIVLHVEY